MKLYYPYFNLFYKKDTTDYHLEVVVKMPGKCYKDEIVQAYVDEYWEVRIKLREKDEDIESQVKFEEYKIPLNPESVKQLEKIKIIVKNYSTLLKDGEEGDGTGKTGSGEGEVEP